MDSLVANGTTVQQVKYSSQLRSQHDNCKVGAVQDKLVANGTTVQQVKYSYTTYNNCTVQFNNCVQQVQYSFKTLQRDNSKAGRVNIENILNNEKPVQYSLTLL